MATVSTEVSDQIEVDKALLLIDSTLDRLDTMLMRRGLKSESMRDDYQDKLFRHKQMLKELFTSEQCIKESHLKHLSQHSDFFHELIIAIKSIREDVYAQVITTLKCSAASRIDYFTALQYALPIGRLSYPEDVAWFHRQNPQLIANYQKQHPDNPVKLMEEEDLIKEACDFKELKFKLANKIIQGSDFFRDRKSSFFQPEDDIKCQAANYLRFHLHESLLSLANDISLNNVGGYVKEFVRVQKRFISDSAKIKPNDVNASIVLPKQAIELLQKHINLVLEPLFLAIEQELQDLVATKALSKLSMSSQ